MICRTARSRSSSGRASPVARFDSAALTVLEEAHIVPNAKSLRVRYGQGKCLRQVPHGVQAALLAVLLGQDVLLGRWQQSQPLLCIARRPFGPIKAVE